MIDIVIKIVAGTFGLCLLALAFTMYELWLADRDHDIYEEC